MYALKMDEQCEKEIWRIIFKNKGFSSALAAKLRRILEDLYQAKPLRNVLSGSYRVHVLKCFVLIYNIDEKGERVLQRRFAHHDEAY